MSAPKRNSVLRDCLPKTRTFFLGFRRLRSDASIWARVGSLCKALSCLAEKCFMSAVRAMACSTQGKVFAAALCGSCDCCMLCAHTSLLHPPSAELLFNHCPPPADGLRAAPAERCTMHGHNFSAPAAQSDELRPVTAPQVCGRAGPSCRARQHTSISAAAHPGGSAPRIPTYSTAQEDTRAFQPGSTADM